MSFSFDSIDFVPLNDGGLRSSTFSAKYFAEEQRRNLGDACCCLCGHYVAHTEYGYCAECFRALCQKTEALRALAEKNPSSMCPDDCRVRDWTAAYLPKTPTADHAQNH